MLNAIGSPLPDVTFSPTGGRLNRDRVGLPGLQERGLRRRLLVDAKDAIVAGDWPALHRARAPRRRCAMSTVTAAGIATFRRRCWPPVGSLRRAGQPIQARRDNSRCHRLCGSDSQASLIASRRAARPDGAAWGMAASWPVTRCPALSRPNTGGATDFRVDQMSSSTSRDCCADAGIDKQPSPQAVEGTRTNMLGPVLEAQR